MPNALLYEVADRVATITLNRPEARNALNAELRGAIPDAMRRADDDDDVDVVILTGSDPAFCAGLDLKELGSQTVVPQTAVPQEPQRPRVARPFGPVSKPVIGAINGPA